MPSARISQNLELDTVGGVKTYFVKVCNIIIPVSQRSDNISPETSQLLAIVCLGTSVTRILRDILSQNLHHILVRTRERDLISRVTPQTSGCCIWPQQSSSSALHCGREAGCDPKLDFISFTHQSVGALAYVYPRKKESP